MKKQEPRVGRPMKLLLQAVSWSVAMVLTGGCMQAPDVRAVQAERAQPLHRFDLLFAAAGNGQVVVAGGAAGAVLRSTDGGQHWQREQLAQPATLVDVAVCPDGSFVGVDFYRKVWFADAQGQHWTARALEQQAQGLAVACGPGNRAWVVGANATIVSTTDQGRHWTTQSLDEDTLLSTVQFIDERHGVITGEFGVVLTSDDAGTTWQRQPVSRPDFYPYATLFADARQGWSVGVAGVILHTQDAGRTWQEQANVSGAVLYRLALHNGVVTGVGSGGVIARLQDGRWQSMPYENPAGSFLTALAPAGPQHLVVTGAGGVLRAVKEAAPGAGQPATATQ